MLVKERYSCVSESLLYEWSLADRTMFNARKVTAYEFFKSVKDLPMRDMKFDQVLRLEDIWNLQLKELKPKRR